MSSEVLIFQGDGDTIVEVFTQTEVLEESSSDTIIEIETLTELLEETEQGVPGPEGPEGPAGGTVNNLQSAGALSALLVVWEDSNGFVLPLSNTDAANIEKLAGVTTTATAGAGSVTVQRYGRIDDSSWSWATGSIWLGLNGALTQTPPTSGFDVLLGYAVSPTRVYLDIQEPINLQE